MIELTLFQVWRQRRTRLGILGGTLVLTGLLAAGCSTTGGLSGSAGGAVVPTSGAEPMAEGRGSPTGIGGIVWGDRDRNGVQDGGEAPVPGTGLTLWLDSNGDGSCQAPVDSPFGSTLSAPDGSYQFGNLPAGSYCVEVTGGQSPTDWQSTMSAPQPVGSAGVTLGIGLP